MTSTQYIVEVKAGAKRQEVLQRDDVLHVYVTANARQGKANTEMIKLLADYFGVSQSSIVVLQGSKNRRKVVEIVSLNTRL